MPLPAASALRRPLLGWMLCALLPAAEVVPFPQLVRPAGEAIPQAELQAAAANAVRAGVLRLIERVRDPRNTSGLVYPPLTSWRSTGTKVIEQHYRIEKRNLYEEKEVDQLGPVRDEYGNVTGYAPRKVKVRVSDKIVGTEDIEVADDRGPISRQITVATGDFSRQLLPRGWYGMNGQALRVLCQAGLGKEEIVNNISVALQGMIDSHGLPDTTWDIAWLTLGFMAASDTDPNLKPRVAALLNRLLDGPLTEGDKRSTARGLWGPVCINAQVQARYFQMELELGKMLAAAKPADGAGKAQVAAKQKEQAQISKALDDLSRAQKTISQQGRRLADIEKNFNINSDIITVGLSHYIYNRMLVDLDSTAVVAMVMAEAAQRKILPQETTRETILGRQVLKNGIRSKDALQDAWQAVVGLAGKDGQYDTGAQVGAIHAYDGMAYVKDVPPSVPLPAILHPETWRSNLSAAAALRSLALVRGKAAAGAEADAVAGNQRRSAEIVQAWLATAPGTRTFKRPHAGESDSLADLEKNKGWPQPPAPSTGPARPVAELPIGYQASPRELLEPLLVVHHQPGDTATTAAARQVAYRLIIEQGADGEWISQAPKSYAPLGNGASEWAYMVGKLARYHLWQVKDDREQGPKDPITGPFQRDGIFTFRHKSGIGTIDMLANVVVWDEGGPPPDSRWPSNRSVLVNLDIAESLAALLYLSDQLAEPVRIDPAALDEIRVRAGEAKKDFDRAVMDLQTTEPDEALRLKKTNDLQQAGPYLAPSQKIDAGSKLPLWNAILAASGETKRVAPPKPAADAQKPVPDASAPVPAVDPQKADPQKADPQKNAPAPGATPQAAPEKSLEDILFKDPKDP